jgi:DNA ligase-associated metallophosphoesterase
MIFSGYQADSYYLYRVLGSTFLLLPEKAIYWKEKKTIILADIHLGKAAHFRKSGVQVPESVHISDYVRIRKLITNFKPEQILILGDLFHSDPNQEWNRFREWIGNQQQVMFLLIKGNHDILPEKLYQISNLEVINESLRIDDFLFIHQAEGNTECYTLSGHIHPAVRIYGPAKQSVTLPCFYFGKKSGILPAFGNFTGFAKIKPKNNDDIFVILDNSVVKI